MFGWTDCICFRQGHWLQSVKCYLYVSPTTCWSGESHLAIWSPETACQTTVISWCSGQNFALCRRKLLRWSPFSVFVFFFQDQQLLLIKIGNIYFYESCVWFIRLKDRWFGPKGGYMEKPTWTYRDQRSLQKLI